MGVKLFFGNKSYIYLYDSEKIVLDTIKKVLLKADRNLLGMTELCKTVKYILDRKATREGSKKKVQMNRIVKGVFILNGIRTCKKVGSRRCLKIFEIRRKRWIKYLPKKKVK